MRGLREYTPKMSVAHENESYMNSERSAEFTQDGLVQTLINYTILIYSKTNTYIYKISIQRERVSESRERPQDIEHILWNLVHEIFTGYRQSIIRNFPLMIYQYPTSSIMTLSMPDRTVNQGNGSSSEKK